MPPLYTLDFEASCLPQHGRSFPIEVGVAGPNGESRSWLIRPEPAWRDWTWTPEAEALHGLSLETLMREGAPAETVLQEVAATLDGKPAIADSYLDAGWMRTLEIAAGAPPLVQVEHVEALAYRWKVDDAEARRAIAHADTLPLQRHRARQDALWLRSVVEGLWAARDSERALAA